jgi:hypothetical protein
VQPGKRRNFFLFFNCCLSNLIYGNNGGFAFDVTLVSKIRDLSTYLRQIRCFLSNYWAAINQF